MITIPIKGQILKDLRKGNKVLQIDVERECEIPLGRLTQFETGRANPTPEHLEKIAKFFKIKPSILIDESELASLKIDIVRLASFVEAKIKF